MTALSDRLEMRIDWPETSNPKMADEALVARLRSGVEAWNDWRKRQDVEPDLRGANLEMADLGGANLSHCDLSEANLDYADLRDSTLYAADLRAASLKDSVLDRASMPLVRLTDATLTNATLDRCDLRGAVAVGATFHRGRLARCNLTSAFLDDADFSYAFLAGSCLVDAHLRNANLARACLRKVDLEGAWLLAARLTRADLSGASLKQANLREAYFFGTSVDAADFEGARLSSAVLSEINLAEASNLERVVHEGPSSIDHQSMFMSPGVPESFLEGCGVPRALISFLPSLIQSSSPIEFYSCFISYSHEDEDFAQRLQSRLRDAGLRVWFAPEDMRAGKKIHHQIDHAIRIYEKLLLILSPSSMASDWVGEEIHSARDQERKEGKQKLFPIRLVDFDRVKEWELFTGGQNLAREIRDYFIPDFSNWKDHDSFEQAFERLLKDLQASTEDQQ